MCPAYQSLSINPANLTQAWPFFAGVFDVATFDAAFSAYLAPGGAFAKQKQKVELGCANYGADFVIQWQRSFLVRSLLDGCPHTTLIAPLPVRRVHNHTLQFNL